MHKTANVLNKVPKSVQPKIKAALHEIWMGETREDAYKAFDSCVKRFEAKYPKAMECLVKDKESLLAFYDFPAAHWQHIRRCPPWRAKRRRVVPGSREATRDTRRAEGAKGDPKGASERGVQSYGRPVCSRNELAMLWRNAG